MTDYLKTAVLKITFLFLLGTFAGKAKAQLKEKPLHNRDKITQSITVKKGTYSFEGTQDGTPVLVIEGDNITIDFNGSVLIGNKNLKEPNKFTGTGILIKKGKNIVLKNAVIRGYKVAILARDVSGLRIINCDLSYNFRQRLHSDRFKEDVSDWQSYHHNDNDQWLRFGAGIYLSHCDGAVIENSTVTNGQCGLMMTHCNNARVYNNNFSFNSGIGIGLYRSNGNYILNNKVDWNVRGYSFGYYYRGQDSGGILVFDQCNHNVFAHNSVTHSGDGFFLWAGQQTMESGKGGCNDNLIYGNDFSYAPTNAIEITFSRNKVIKNKLHDSWHGIWGGFSYNTVIVNNDFGGNLAGISIEHGQDNIIEHNSFSSDSLAIELWAVPDREPNSYMKARDTRSRNYTLTSNVFTKVPVVFSIKNTESVTIAKNQYTGYRTLQKMDHVKDVDYSTRKTLYDYTGDSVFIASLLPGITKQDAMLPSHHPKGKKNIMMTEWGPYNFQYPLLWWTSTDSSGKMNFEIRGPQGEWKLKQTAGVTLLSSSRGTIPGTLQVQKQAGDHPIVIELQYTGEEIVSPFGEVVPAGQPYTFDYRETTLPMKWKVSWFRFDSTNDPVKKPAAFRALLDSKPLKTVQTTPTDYGRAKWQSKEVPNSHFAALVETEVDAPKGTYRVGVTAGDIVRVYIDGKLVIDAWNPSAIVFDADYHKEATVKLNGKHKIRIVKAQYGTYGMLSCKIKRID